MTKVQLPGQNTAGQPNGYAALDGNSGLLVPTYLARAAQAAPAAPSSGFRDYIDSADGQAKTIDAAGTVRRIVRDYGVGTSLPALTAGTSRGDVYTHSGIGCQFTWNGATWRQSTRVIVTTEAQLAAIATSYAAALHDGLEAFAQDTKARAMWDATNTAWRMWDNVDQAWTPAITAGGTAIGLGAGGTVTGAYRRMGKLCWVNINMNLGTTPNGGTGTWTITIPFSGTSAREQILDCKAYTYGSMNWFGFGIILAGAPTYLQPYLPTSNADTRMKPVQNSDPSTGSAGAVPGGTGSFPFAAGSNMTIDGIYETATG